jgi:hypothetical protein
MPNPDHHDKSKGSVKSRVKIKLERDISARKYWQLSHQSKNLRHYAEFG